MARQAKAITPAALAEHSKAYRQCFGSPAGQEVLKDLMEFCRADTPCFDPDPRVHALLEGRREVFLRIQARMRLSVGELWTLLGGGSLKPPTEEPENEMEDPTRL